MIQKKEMTIYETECPHCKKKIEVEIPTLPTVRLPRTFVRPIPRPTATPHCDHGPQSQEKKMKPDNVGIRLGYNRDLSSGGFRGGSK